MLVDLFWDLPPISLHMAFIAWVNSWQTGSYVGGTQLPTNLFERQPTQDLLVLEPFLYLCHPSATRDPQTLADLPSGSKRSNLDTFGESPYLTDNAENVSSTFGGCLESKREAWNCPQTGEGGTQSDVVTQQ